MYSYVMHLYHQLIHACYVMYAIIINPYLLYQYKIQYVRGVTNHNAVITMTS